MEEIWKDIKNFEKLYQISNKGRIKNKYGRILKTAVNHNGYIVVYLCKNNKKCSKRVHRLVAEAFIPKVDGKDQVNHIDCNKKNNNVENLEWCTPYENIKHAYINNLYEKQRNYVRKTLSEHSTAKPVNQFDINGNFIKRWSCIKEAGLFFGRNKPTSISSCCKGRYHTAYGFKWEYAKLGG